MNASTLLELAVSIATEAHRSQTDRNGQPYILHPLRVMARVQSEIEKIVAVLHDVVEDTSVTMQQLRDKGFPEQVLEALDSVTKREGEPYEAFVLRSGRNSIGRRVKLADLEDNMDIRRLPQVGEADLARLNKYLRAWRELLKAETEG